MTLHKVLHRSLRWSTLGLVSCNVFVTDVSIISLASGIF